MEKAWSLALWSVLVCYNTGYRVGKLKGLPSRRKGMKSGELAFTDALNEEDAKRIEVVSLLKCVPGIGASKAEAIRRLVKIPLGRRVSGLGIRQREELTALEKNGWKMTAQKSKAL